MENKRQKLDQYLKQMKQGNPLTDSFVGRTGDVFDDALVARNLSEEALAREFLKNTGLPVPGKGASRAQLEDFLSRSLKEIYPEIEPELRIGGLNDQYGQNRIDISDYTAKQPIETTLGTAFHEGGHAYDKQILGVDGKPISLGDLRKAKSSGLNLKQMDPLQVYDEIVGAKHHAKIPNLREGSYGFGALKSLLKSGTFKGVGPIAATAGAVTAASASDALADTLVPGGVESVGQGSDKVLSPEQEQSVEASRQLSSGSPMNEQRLRALQKMVQGK
jgi:hypothetical protein